MEAVAEGRGPLASGESMLCDSSDMVSVLDSTTTRPSGNATLITDASAPFYRQILLEETTSLDYAKRPSWRRSPFCSETVWLSTKAGSCACVSIWKKAPTPAFCAVRSQSGMSPRPFFHSLSRASRYSGGWSLSCWVDSASASGALPNFFHPAADPDDQSVAGFTISDSSLHEQAFLVGVEPCSIPAARKQKTRNGL
ncbi:hypothetical protein [Paraburkholderia diazotrophica]|uniref:hypothetical protein n=1 Tax=Paraburkholderia diazotrophica TaxID=667676 RepID=UPI00316E6226